HRDDVEDRGGVVAAWRADTVSGVGGVDEGGRGAGAVVGVPVASGAGLGVLFTGEGSQGVGMAAGVYASWVLFRAAFDEVVGVLDRYAARTLKEVVFAHPEGPDATRLHRTEFTQPA
ncbi:hypothetical protein VM98_35555, partial [Streptomyces rubellomurinus subsp. indigoferus]